MSAEFIGKQIFGSALHDHRWNSFPSGTATISAAIVATLWLAAPRLRLPSLFLAVLVCSAVVVTNGHWVSDVIAGAFLGASIGWMTVLLLRSHDTSTTGR